MKLQLQYVTVKGYRMNLIRFTFANIFDFKSVIDTCSSIKISPFSGQLHSSNSDKLIIVFQYVTYTNPYIEFVNSICTPTNIEDLHE